MNINDLRSLWKQAFGDTDDFLDDFFCVVYSEDRCNTIEKDGNLAAMLYWFDCLWEGKKVAYLYAVATDEAYRNQGLCRALMEDTHKKLQALGYAGAVLVPGSKELFGLYEKFGYIPFCNRLTITVDAGSEKADFAALSTKEYYSRRLPLLPAGSIAQDRLTIDFLATFCKLYGGDDYLFCGGLEDDTFYFQEFLGSPGRVPKILKTLGAEKGILRIPGDTPFAMYLPLDGTTELPNYFDIPLN